MAVTMEGRARRGGREEGTGGEGMRGEGEEEIGGEWGVYMG